MNTLNTNNIVLISWKNEYYISFYNPLDADNNIVKIAAKKIEDTEFKSYSEMYPIVKINDDVMFDVGDNVEHILKIHTNAALGRLNLDDVEKVCKNFDKDKIIYDVQPYFKFVNISSS